MADKMWDILNFLKNPPGDGVMEKNAAAMKRIRQINEQLEDAIENPRPEQAQTPVKETDAMVVVAEDAVKDAETQDKKIEQNVPVPDPAQMTPAADEPGEIRDDAPETAPGRLIGVPVDMVEPNPFQPRKELGEQEIAELSESIKELGVLQPILVRPNGQKYELIAGERRLRASILAGLKSIPAIVVDAEPLHQQIIALVENIQRKNLSSVEEAASLQDILSKTGWSQSELSRRMGRSQASIANKLRLLRLDPVVQELVLTGKLGERQARALLSLSPEDQITLAQKAVFEEMSVRALETAAENWNRKPRTARHRVNRESSEVPGGELLGDIATLVNKHKSRGTMARWKVKQMNQSSLVVEITVDLMRNSMEDEDVSE
ncbi:MAG: ParB/RepB/Spo0J family partition protein [Synergistaceae bacterium]|nr:ParB/RepB/Spo0J family partition protein [Synergistaceae bacterium]